MHRLPAFHLLLSNFRILFVFLCWVCLCSCGTTIPSNIKYTPTSVSQAGTLLHAYSDQLVASVIAWSPEEVTYPEQFVSNGPELAWSPDGTRIASGGEDIHIWNAATGQTQISYTSSTTGFNAVNALAWSPDGTRIALAGARTQEPDQVQVWDIRTGKMVWEVAMQARIQVVDWSGNGKWLAIATEIAVQLSDAETGKIMNTYSGYIGVVTSISWSPDSNYLASSESGGTVRLQNVSTGQSRPFFSTDGAEPIIFVAWSPKGRYLAFSPIDDTVRIWDTSTKHLIATCSAGGQNSAMAVAWSPDGTMIATADTSRIEGFEIWRAIP